jgi:esterase/lipase superfamily enzyme
MHNRRIAALIALWALAFLPACTPVNSLMPTPTIYEGPGARPIFAGAFAANPPRVLDLLYVTDREPITGSGGELAYGTTRSRVMTFGSLPLAIESEDGKASGAAAPGLFKLGTPRMIGAFPQTPYSVRKVAGGFTRAPAVVNEHAAAVRALQAEVSRRLANAQRKEVVIFIHGYNNTFDDAAYSTGNICRFLGAEFVCVVLSWPAGGSSGVFMGYNVDRESGELAVADMRKAIRAIGETNGIARMHIIAHSRGTDVTASALQQLGIESYAMKSSLSQRLKINNVVLASPDIDIDIAASKILTIASDPNLPFGAAPRPSGVFSQGDIHLSIYSSPNDKALGMSGLLFGSVLRLGQLDPTKRAAEMAQAPPELGGLVDFIEFTGSTNFLGHNYFLSDPQVSADIVGLIRYRLKAGDPGRPLVENKRPFWRIAAAQAR